MQTFKPLSYFQRSAVAFLLRGNIPNFMASPDIEDQTRWRRCIKLNFHFTKYFIRVSEEKNSEAKWQVETHEGCRWENLHY